mgnify:FL=1
MPLREPDLISHGLYVWPLLPALRASWTVFLTLQCLGSVALDGFDGIDGGSAEAVLFEGSDAADGCTAR